MFELHLKTYKMSSEQKPVLYSYWRSSCSWRVRIVLALKNVDYEYKTVDLLSEEAKTNLKQINPAGKVPTLIVNNEALTESLAIIEYLEDAFPNSPILPKDPIKRAQARSIALVVASGIQPLHNLNVLKCLNAKESGFGGEFASINIKDGLKNLELILKKTSGKYAVGDEISIADIVIPPLIYSAKRFNLDMSGYPTVMKINDTLATIPAFIAAHPDNQPDTGLNA